jgi:hypothetical protein
VAVWEEADMQMVGGLQILGCWNEQESTAGCQAFLLSLSVSLGEYCVYWLLVTEPSDGGRFGCASACPNDNDGTVTQLLERGVPACPRFQAHLSIGAAMGCFEKVLPHLDNGLRVGTWQLVFYGAGILWETTADPSITAAVPER